MRNKKQINIKNHTYYFFDDMISITSNDYKNVCGSCTIYIVLLVKFFIISISVSSIFIYFYWYLKKNNTCVTSFNPSTEIVIY